MDEATWLACNDPRRMLESLRGKASNRKLRLFACACCRGGWEWLEGDTVRQAVEVAERCADGLAPAEELAAAWETLGRFRDPSHGGPSWASGVACAEAWTAAWCLCGRAGEAAQGPVSRQTVQEDRPQGIGGKAVGRMAGQAARATPDSATRAESAFLRDLFGLLPFCPVLVDPAWLTPTVVSLAHAAYNERDLPSGHLDPARLAVLADAKE